MYKLKLFLIYHFKYTVLTSLSTVHTNPKPIIPTLKYLIKQSNGILIHIPPINDVNLIGFVSLFADKYAK